LDCKEIDMFGKNVLIIAPHPDDEVLGCGGTIARLAAGGKSIHILVATGGSARFFDREKVLNVRNEALRAHKILGVKDTMFLDFPAPELDTVPLADISTEFAKVIDNLGIDTLFLPHEGDIHNDHRVVFSAGLVASRPVGGCPVKSVFAYETLSETEWGAPYAGNAFIPTHFVNIADTFDIKIAAMECYASQLRVFPNPRSEGGMRALAMLRGATVGCGKAEAFVTIRTIVD
jgi:LmbE family N-acetylglucosaminyl deacetylase